eukprot:2951148-Amphidinium_carterae.1
MPTSTRSRCVCKNPAFFNLFLRRTTCDKSDTRWQPAPAICPASRNSCACGPNIEDGLLTHAYYTCFTSQAPDQHINPNAYHCRCLTGVTA